MRHTFPDCTVERVHWKLDGDHSCGFRVEPRLKALLALRKATALMHFHCHCWNANAAASATACAVSRPLQDDAGALPTSAELEQQACGQPQLAADASSGPY